MNQDEKLFFKAPFTIAVLLGTVLLLFWGLSSMPLAGINEGRRALTALEMVRNGNWLIPTMNGHFYIDKPPMLYWLMVISAKIFQSTSEWVFRLPSALAAFATCALLYRSARKYINNDIAILSILILATSLSFTRSAHRAEIEILLTFFCFAANIFFFDFYMSKKKIFLWLSYLSMGLALLTKGPVALVFFVPPLLLFGLLNRKSVIWRGLFFWPGWLLMLAIGISWYVAIWFSAAGPLLRQVIEIDIVGKSLGGLSDSKPFYIYTINLLGIFAPWTLIALFRAKKFKLLFSNQPTTYFTLLMIVPLVIMSLIASKHNKYILPLFPPLALFLAVFLRDFYGWLIERYQPDGDKYFTRFAIFLIVVYLLFFAVLEPRIYRYRTSAFKPLIAKIHEVDRLAPIYCLGEKKFLQLLFYYERPIPSLNISEINEMLAAKKKFLLLAESHSWPLLPPTGLNTIFELKPFRSKDRAVKLLTNLDNLVKNPEYPNKSSSLGKTGDHS